MTSETSCPHLLWASTPFLERHPEERAAKPRASKGGALARSCPPSTDLGFTEIGYSVSKSAIADLLGSLASARSHLRMTGYSFGRHGIRAEETCIAVRI